MGFRLPLQPYIWSSFPGLYGVWRSAGVIGGLRGRYIMMIDSSIDNGRFRARLRISYQATGMSYRRLLPRPCGPTLSPLDFYLFLLLSLICLLRIIHQHSPASIHNYTFLPIDETT